MSKSQKKQNDKRLKKHLHLNLTAELYEKIKETGLNVSRFAEEALNALISGKSFENIQNTLILRLKSEKECCEPDSNRRPSDYESDALNGSKSGNKQGNGDSENFSGHAGERRNVKPKPNVNARSVTIEDVKDGDMLSPNEGYSMAVFMASRKSDYLKSKEGTDSKTVGEYLSAISKLDWLFSYEDLKEKSYLTKSEKDAIYQIMAYLEKYVEDESGTYNGTIYQNYRVKATELNRASKGSRKSQKTNELILFPEVVTKTQEELPDDVQMFFIMCIFGGRVAQLYRLFENNTVIDEDTRKPKNMIKVTMSPDKKYFWVNGESANIESDKSKKRVFQYFFPSYMLPIVQNYRNLRGKKRKEPEGAYSEEVQKVSRVANRDVPCNLSSLRKFSRAILTESGLPYEVGEYTQGRTVQGVGPKAYDNLEVAAKRDFGKTIPTWDKYVYIPDWMKDAKEIIKRLDKIEEELKEGNKKPTAGRSQLPKEIRAEIVRRLKAGESQRSIASAVGVNRDTVANISKKEGLGKKKKN